MSANNLEIIKRPVSWLLVLCLGLVFSSCVYDKTSDMVEVGDNLPDFEVELNDGSHVSNKSLKGSISVITLFSTICPDCKATLPHIQKLYEAYPEVRFVNISRAQGPEKVQSLWDELGLTMPYSAQETADVYKLFAQSVVPRVYISDRHCTVRYIHTDNPNPTFEALSPELETLIH